MCICVCVCVCCKTLIIYIKNQFRINCNVPDYIQFANDQIISLRRKTTIVRYCMYCILNIMCRIVTLKFRPLKQTL